MKCIQYSLYIALLLASISNTGQANPRDINSIVMQLESGNGFQFKELSEIPQLSTFDTTNQFEEYWNRYQQNCYDNSGGGRGGIRCAIGEKVWDRELNIYYNLLRSILSQDQKDELKSAQLKWLKVRGHSLDLSRSLINEKYKDKQGSMYSLLWSADYDRLISPIIRERALTLKRLYDQAHPIYRPKEVAYLKMNKQLTIATKHPENEKRKKAAYKLKSNFMYDQSQGDVSFIDKNIDILIKFIIDPVIAQDVIDLLITKSVTDLNGESFEYLLKRGSKGQINRSIEQLSFNLSQDNQNIQKQSAKALILLNACSKKDQIQNKIDQHKWKPYYVDIKRLNCN